MDEGGVVTTLLPLAGGDGPTLLHTIDNPNPHGTSQNNQFGRSVSINGDRAIVGSFGQSVNGDNASGEAYIFNITTGALLHTMANPNGWGTGEDDQFGSSVAIEGDYAIVGAPYEDLPSRSATGKAYIFDATTGSLLHTLDNPITSSVNALFGSSVSISGTTVVVSAPGQQVGGDLSSGKAYIYDAITGTLLHILDNPNASGTPAYDQFGNSVSISGDNVIVGAHYEDNSANSGRVYIFNTTSGALLHTINNPNAYGTSIQDRFGFSVSISGDYAIASAHYEDDAGGTSSGKAYIFDVTTGALLHTLDNPSAFGTSADDQFGHSTSISDTYAIVGARTEDDAGGIQSGKSYIYDIITGALLHTLDNPNAYSTSATDNFGHSTSISGNYAIVGAYYEHDADGEASGKVYIFELAAPANGAVEVNTPNTATITFTTPTIGTISIS